MIGPRQLFAFLAPYDCFGCGREGALLCARCLPLLLRPSNVDGVLAGADYEGAVRQLIHKYKFEFARDAAADMVSLLEAALPPLPTDTIVTYVPTATSRIRQRGFDHARQLALELAKKRGLKFESILLRQGQQRQVGTTRQDRQHQAAGIYRVKAGTDLAGRKILLIDDVVTTGATIRSASRVLLAAGAQQVETAAAARKR